MQVTSKTTKNNLSPRTGGFLYSFFLKTTEKPNCYNLIMKKLFKILAILAVLAAILLIAAFITLKIMFPADKLKTMAQQYTQKNFNREIAFSDVSFNLIGITLDDFALSESGTFQENGTFAKADQAIVKIAFTPLLKKRIEVSTIGLEGLDITVIKNKDGKFNFDDFLTPSTQESTPNTTIQTKEEKKENSSFEITAEKVYATDCNLYYKDLQNNMQASVTKLNLQINAFDLHTPFPISFSFITDYQDSTGLTVQIPVRAELMLSLAGLDMPKASAEVQKFTLDYKEIFFGLQGSATNFANPSINLQGKISGLSNKALADLTSDLPDFILPDILFSAQTDLNLDKSSADIKQAKLSIQDSAITAQGNVSWGGNKTSYQVNSSIGLDLSQIAKMAKMMDGFGLGGKVSGNIRATDKNNAQDMSGKISLSDLKVQYAPMDISSLQGDIVLKSLGDISCNSLKGLLNGEKFDASFAYKDLSGVLDLVFHFDLDKLTLTSFDFQNSSSEKEATAQQTPTPAEEKTASAETFFNVKGDIKIGQIKVPYFTTQGITLNANVQHASASMKKTNGTVSFNLQEGAITDLNSFVKESKIVKILLLPFTIINKVTSKLGVEIFPTQKAEDKGKIKFSSGSGSYLFKNGLMTIEETHFNSAVSDMKAAGSLDFNTEKLDMKVSATVLTSQTPIVIKIGGTITEPSGKLDVAGTAISLVGGILNYKTPVKAAKTTAGTAKTVVDNTAQLGTTAVKDTVNTAVDTIKSIGGLFKSSKKETSDSK